MTPTPTGDGYYLTASDGGVFCFGDAISHFYGSNGSNTTGTPTIGLIVTPTGTGTWGYNLINTTGTATTYGP